MAWFVSKAPAANANQRYTSTSGARTKAVAAACKALGIQGFGAIGGKFAQGKSLHTKTVSFIKA